MQLPLCAHLGGDYAVDSEQYHAVGISSSSESHEICFEVAASDDAVSEGTEIETFQLLLSTDVSWVILDVPRETTVDIVILDNDGKVKTFSFTLLVIEPPLKMDTLEHENERCPLFIVVAPDRSFLYREVFYNYSERLL